MATDLERLVVSLEANIKKYESSLAKAMSQTDSTVKGIEGRFNKMNPKFSGMTAGISFLNKGLAGLAAYVSVSTITSWVQDAVKSMSEVADAADRAQVSTDFIQAVGFAAEQAGGTLQDAAKAATKFQIELGAVGSEGNDLSRFLEANGVALRDQNNNLRDGTVLFGEWARLVANVKDPQVQMNLVSREFGEKVGPKMLTTILDIGRIGLPAFIQKMKEAGVVLEEGFIRRGDEVGDKFALVMKRMTKGFQEFVVTSADGYDRIAKIVENLQNLAKSGTTLTAKDNTIELLEKQAADLRVRIANAEQQGAIGTGLTTAQLKMVEQYRGELQEILRNVTLIRAINTTPSAAASGTPPKLTVVPPPGPPPPPPPNTAKKIDDFKQLFQQLEKTIALEGKELELIDATAYAREHARVTLLLETAAKQANTEAGLKNVEATEEQRVKIDALAHAAGTLAEAQKAANGPMRDFARDAADVNTQLQSAGVDGLRGFEDALISIGMRTTSVSDAFKKMAASILQDLARIAIRSAITAPLASFFGGLFSPIPGKALGGPVAAGRPYLVGERGSEIFVPKTAGNIIPHEKARGMRGGASISVNTSIDARGSDMGEGKFRSILAEHEKRIKQQIVPIVREAHSRKMLA